MCVRNRPIEVRTSGFGGGWWMVAVAVGLLGLAVKKRTS